MNNTAVNIEEEHCNSNWKVEVGARKNIVGSLESSITGAVELYIDDILTVRFPITYDASLNKSSYFFRPHANFIKSLPSIYSVKLSHPDGHTYVIPGSSVFGEGDNTFAEKLSNGYLVSAKGGYLYKPISERLDWKAEIFESYKHAQKALQPIAGISELFVAYGTLLGQARAGDFIAHDDDFDCGFIIDVDSPEEAAAKFHSVIDILRKEGYNVTFKNHVGNFLLKFPGLPVIELWCLSNMESTSELWGYNFTMDTSSKKVLPTTTAKLSQNDVLVPANTVALLAAIYGESWKTPDSSFQWRPSKRSVELMGRFSVESKRIVDLDS